MKIKATCANCKCRGKLYKRNQSSEVILVPTVRVYFGIEEDERYEKGLLNRPNGIQRNANPFSHDNSGYHVYVDEKKCTQKAFDGCCSICTGPTLYDYCWAKCASKPENHDYFACSLRPRY